jgi:D-3-phosphoglycerate dehydrogenase / 2-oxoglutarate reductase
MITEQSIGESSADTLRRVVVTDCVGYPAPGSIEREGLGAGYEVAIAGATTEEEVIEVALEAEGLFVNMAPVTKKVLRALPKLRALVRYGVGMDNVDCDEAAVLGIAALNVPDYAVGEVAQHAVSMVIARARRLIEFDKAVKAGAWGPDIIPAPVPSDEDTVGLAGFGNIGRRTAEILRANGFPVIAWDPYVPEDAFVGVERVLSLAELVGRARHVSLHLPATEATIGMVNREILDKLGPEGHLVNTGRGPVVDEAALLTALDAGAIAWASLDVWATEPPNEATARLVVHPRVTATPHVAYLSTQSQARLRRLAALRLKAALEANN